MEESKKKSEGRKPPLFLSLISLSLSISFYIFIHGFFSLSLSLSFSLYLSLCFTSSLSSLSRPPSASLSLLMLISFYPIDYFLLIFPPPKKKIPGCLISQRTDFFLLPTPPSSFHSSYPNPHKIQAPQILPNHKSRRLNWFYDCKHARLANG